MVDKKIVGAGILGGVHIAAHWVGANMLNLSCFNNYVYWVSPVVAVTYFILVKTYK